MIPTRTEKSSQNQSVHGSRLNLVTQGPARLADFTDRGQIAEGLSADLAAVDMSAGTPIVRQAWRNGALRLGLR